MSQVTGARYSLFVDERALPEGELNLAVGRFLLSERWMIERRGKEGERKLVDLRPLVRSVELGPAREGVLSLEVELVCAEGPQARPADVLGALGLDPGAARVLRRDTRLKGSLIPSAVPAELSA